MRGWAILFIVITAIPARAEDPFPARTGPDFIPREHTHERAGTVGVAKFTQPSISRFDSFGMVNGATFGSDFVGFGRSPGRLFPGLWPYGRKPKSYSDKFATDGKIHVPDLIATKPVRKAVIEAKSETK